MNLDTQLPLAFFHAQMTLFLRSSELLQESGQRWLELANLNTQRGVGEAASTPLTDWSAAPDWQKLAHLPADAFWRSLQRSLVVPQETLLTAVNNQTALGAGLRRALADWQHETAQAVSHASNAMPLHATLTEMLSGMGSQASDDTRAAKRKKTNR